MIQDKLFYYGFRAANIPRKGMVYISLIVLYMLFSFKVIAQTKVVSFNKLSLHEATSLALENNPSIRLANSAYNVNVAGLRQSRSGLFPNINFSAQGSRTEGAFIFNPDFPAREQKYNNYTTGISINQLIYDFGRTTSRIEASEDLVDASNYDYISAKENVIVNVQVAYFSYLQAQYVAKVNEDLLRQAEEHLKIAKAFYSAGQRPQYDVTKAEVDVANANVNLLGARNQVQITRLQLENAMGIQNPELYTVTDSLAIVPFNISIDSARAISFNSRSELKALNFRLQANENLVSSAWSQNLPALTAFGTYNWNGFEPTSLKSRWNAGVTFNFPIFQGFAVSAQVEQNQANVQQVQANIESTRQAILLEVSQYYLSMKEALNRIDAANKLIQSTVENLRLAEGRYNSGVGSATEITDAQLLLSNARITYIQGLYDYNTSVIRLKKSMGIISNGS
ncbi:MAG: TolC family protein [Bacteroidota bacterium]|nr:TolC family protein [Bacteroidota bacterium]